MSRKQDSHVTPHPDGGWQVKREGADRASSRHLTQSDALEQARASARREGTEVVIHDGKGHVRDSDSFGRESRVKDKRH